MEFFLQVLVGGLAVGALYGAVALGFVLMWNSASVVNFGQGDLVMIGGFFGYTLVGILHLPYLIGIPGALIGSFALGVLMHRLVIVPAGRAPLFAIIIITLGVAILLQQVALNTWGAASVRLPGIIGDEPVRVGGVIVQRQDLVVFFACFLMVVCLETFFARTLTGKAMRAVAQDPDTALLMGIPGKRMVSIAFGLSAAMAALAGVLLAPITYLVWNQGLSITLLAFAGAVLGGFGSLRGAFVGSLIIGVIVTFASAYVNANFAIPVAFMVLVIVLLLRPAGIFRSAWA
jgi:branched-chain amino acid transport system permease protein